MHLPLSDSLAEAGDGVQAWAQVASISRVTGSPWSTRAACGARAELGFGFQDKAEPPPGRLQKPGWWECGVEGTKLTKKDSDTNTPFRRQPKGQ